MPDTGRIEYIKHLSEHICSPEELDHFFPILSNLQLQQLIHDNVMHHVAHCGSGGASLSELSRKDI